MKVNIYVESGKKLQKITNLKKLTNTSNISKSRKITIFLSLKCLTHIYNTFILHFLAAYYFIASSYDKDFVILFFIQRTER